MGKAAQENIRQLLSKTGVTHQELARIAGVDRSAVSQWVSGRTEPRERNILKIAEHYGISPECLSEPQGMRYVRKGVDGKLRDDNNARLKDLRKAIIASLGTDAESSTENVLAAMMAFAQTASRSTALTGAETDLVEMFRLLDDDARKMILEVACAFVSSGTHLRSK